MRRPSIGSRSPNAWPWAFAVALAVAGPTGRLHGQDSSSRRLIQVPSSVDRSLQPSYLFLPIAHDSTHPAPLAVLLHTWSFDLEQRHRTVEREAARRGWILLEPNFRGRNDHPEACGSAIGQQDVLDAVGWVRNRYAVDPSRIYVLGLSGGGFMTMLMVGRAPALWAAASAWVGIGDLAKYHDAHANDGDGAMTRQCLGGPPSQSAEIAAEYRARSPVTHLAGARQVPLEIAAGRRDPEVAISQSIGAFNVIAVANNTTPVTADELAQLDGPGDGLLRPAALDTTADPTLGRRIFLRRLSGPSRLTIFEGAHEWVPAAAMSWLAEHRKPPVWQLLDDWPRTPNALNLGQVSGVGVDRKGHVLLFHRAGRTFDTAATIPIAAATVLELDPADGRLIRSWGANRFLIPHSLTVDSHDNVWVTDAGSHEVFKFSHNGSLLLTVGTHRVPGRDSTHFDKPNGVAIEPDGTFYVSDGYGNARIVKFSPKGRYLKEWGSPGSGPGELRLPHGVTLDGRGAVYVADRENHRVQVFDTAGTFRQLWPNTADTGRVYDVAVTPSGTVYLARGGRPEAVGILDAAFNVVGVIAAAPGQIQTPHAIAVVGDTVMYIADAAGQRILKLVRR